MINAQGEDVVAGIRTPSPVEEMPKWNKKVYKELGGYEERFIQMALAVELRENKIDFLRETNIELFYKNHALGLGELDFLIYPCMDLKGK